MFAALLDCFFPRRSLTGTEGAFITTEELRQLRLDPVIEDTATLRRQGIRALSSLRAALPYEQSPLVRSAVWNFKYRRLPAYAAVLGGLIAAAAEPVSAAAVLCPVPLHWTRRFERGFNQAALLADVVSRTRGLPVVPLLRRCRATGHQAHRGRRERLGAVSGAFVCQKEPPAHVILIDDLATTGTTLDACAAVLLAQGAKRVDAWVLARGGKPFLWQNNIKK